MSSIPDQHLQEILSGVGASKIIYSLVMPETETVKRKVFAGDYRSRLHSVLNLTGSLADAQSIADTVDASFVPYFDNFREAWTQKQDAAHEGFFDEWTKWVSPIVAVGSEFSYRYPTSGASEGLRVLIDEYGARSRRDKFEPEIHLFAGEYDGFGAYSRAAFIPVIEHDRGKWQEAVEKLALAAKDRPIQLYISQPSAIDGNVWPHYDEFMQALAEKAPRVEVIADLTYVGCISKEAKIQIDYPNIPAVVFSLSKPVGGYYDRIGGVIARPRPDNDKNEALPGLFGNKWFKNLTSLAIGTEFMKSYGVYEMPRKYKEVQDRAIVQISRNLAQKGHDVELRPSDVFILATAEMPKIRGEIHNYLKRPGDGRDILRLCLTPTMSEMIGTAKTHEVTPRYYERAGDGAGR